MKSDNDDNNFSKNIMYFILTIIILIGIIYIIITISAIEDSNQRLTSMIVVLLVLIILSYIFTGYSVYDIRNDYTSEFDKRYNKLKNTFSKIDKNTGILVDIGNDTHKVVNDTISEFETKYEDIKKIDNKYGNILKLDGDGNAQICNSEGLNCSTIITKNMHNKIYPIIENFDELPPDILKKYSYSGDGKICLAEGNCHQLLTSSTNSEGDNIICGIEGDINICRNISEFRGPPGADGSPGPPGTDGTPGTDGKDGVDGAPGQRGEQGLRGLRGEGGAHGLDGTDGVDGVGCSVSMNIGEGTYTILCANDSRVTVPYMSIGQNDTSAQDDTSATNEGVGDCILDGTYILHDPTNSISPTSFTISNMAIIDEGDYSAKFDEDVNNIIVYKQELTSPNTYEKRFIFNKDNCRYEFNDSSDGYDPTIYYEKGETSNIYYKNKSYNLNQHTEDIYLHLMLPDSINIDDYSNIDKYEEIDSPLLTTLKKGYKLKNLKFLNDSFDYNNYINMTKEDDNNYNVNIILVHSHSNAVKQIMIYSFVLKYINARKCYNINKISMSLINSVGSITEKEYDNVNIDYCENQDNFSLFYDNAEGPIQIHRCGTGEEDINDNDKFCAILYNTENLCEGQDSYKYCNWASYPQIPASDFTWVDDSVK